MESWRMEKFSWSKTIQRTGFRAISLRLFGLSDFLRSESDIALFRLFVYSVRLFVRARAEERLNCNWSFGNLTFFILLDLELHPTFDNSQQELHPLPWSDWTGGRHIILWIYTLMKSATSIVPSLSGNVYFYVQSVDISGKVWRQAKFWIFSVAPESSIMYFLRTFTSWIKKILDKYEDLFSV